MRPLIHLFLIAALSLLATAQEQKEIEPTPPTPTLTAEEKKREALNSILAQKESLRAEIEKNRKVTQNNKLTDYERQAAAEEIAALQVKIQNLQNEFSILTTGLNLENLGADNNEDLNLNQELKEVLRPIIQEFREITAAPRESEELRIEIASLKEQLATLETATSALRTNFSPANPKTLNTALDEKLAELDLKKQNLETALGIAEAKLAERVANTPTFFTSLSEMVQEFFRSRGAHLLIALAIAALIVLLIRFAYRIILRFAPKKINRAENFTGRLIHLSYVIFSILGALLAFIITLYLTNDWLLLALALLFVLGIAWAGKNTVPHYLEQAKMILNLGSVRHGERIIYHGIPWEVQKINFYTTLKNPSLEGGLVRLPIRDLMPLHSRPNGTRELWFPTHEDDWVILSDDSRTIGKVIQQTPDYVHLVKLGGARMVIPTQDFLSLHPENISKNFRISVTFGIDYRHQKIAVREVPLIFKAALQRALLEKVDKEQLYSLQVFFTAAAASSLDYRVVADFSGDLAPRLNTLKDFIQATCVETCNANDWNIPFTQITLHQADSPPPPPTNNPDASRSLP